MPVYEYECKACHREFEYQQRMSDPDKTVCEVCGGALERLISRTAFQLKGSGWYKDLYSSSKPDAPAKDAAAGEAKPEAKTESKPEAKSDAGSAAPAKPEGSSGSSGSGGGSSDAKAAS
ncbi:MAG TPA: zinc ribbon domain-containing protein [Kofleriaceae bacterium]|nr:zinc ribbon domain-containing protein [Kofleriaceae bacterium]